MRSVARTSTALPCVDALPTGASPSSISSRSKARAAISDAGSSTSRFQKAWFCKQHPHTCRRRSCMCSRRLQSENAGIDSRTHTCVQQVVHCNELIFGWLISWRRERADFHLIALVHFTDLQKSWAPPCPSFGPRSETTLPSAHPSQMPLAHPQ